MVDEQEVVCCGMGVANVSTEMNESRSSGRLCDAS